MEKTDALSKDCLKIKTEVEEMDELTSQESTIACSMEIVDSKPACVVVKTEKVDPDVGKEPKADFPVRLEEPKPDPSSVEMEEEVADVEEPIFEEVKMEPLDYDDCERDNTCGDGEAAPCIVGGSDIEVLLKRSHEESKLKGNTILECCCCAFSTHYPSQLRKHMKQHVKKLPYQCPQCDFSSVRGNDLRTHIRSKHTNERPHRCPYCDFSYVQVNNLKNHIRSKHTKERPHQCPHCDYTCVQVGHLKSHIRNKHTNYRPHRCPHCDYSAAQGSNLKSHIQRKHTKDRPFQCPHCDYSSVQGRDLKFHIRSKHTNERPHECPHCEYSCVQENNLKYHIQSKHTHDRPYQCPFCEYSSVQGGHLKLHIQSKHTLERTHKCPHCSYSCVHRNRLKIHIKRMHPTLHTEFSPLQEFSLIPRIENEDVAKQAYICTECGFQCDKRSTIKGHLQKQCS